MCNTKQCPYCGESILEAAIKCKHCLEFLDDREEEYKEEEEEVFKPMCQSCGGEMRKTVISSGNCGGIVLALIVFCIGIGIFLFFPVVGWIIGPLIAFGALFMGGKRSKVLKCRRCGFYVNRT